MTNDIFAAVYDQYPATIAVVDAKGLIVTVNKSWIDYAATNEHTSTTSWIGVSYIDECTRAARRDGHVDAKIVLTGMEAVLQRRSQRFEHQYPCHSPTRSYWYNVRILPLDTGQQMLFMVIHENCTHEVLLRHSLQLDANTDALTNLANRRGFDSFVDQKWQQCQRCQDPLSLLLIDIDHFKSLNDHYGHHIGDDCLVQVAKLVSGAVRGPSDFCARIGGEEFVLVLSRTNLDDAITIAERILHSVHARVELAVSTSTSVTVSIGVASVTPQDHLNPMVLLKRADQAMYRAKNSGRNQVSL